MHPVPARTASSDPQRFWATLASFVDEVYGTMARLFAYLMTLALIAICGIALWDHLPAVDAIAAGNAAKLTELLAPAKVGRSDHAGSGAPAASGDWLMDADNLHLRGPQ